jgi:hypothetical protein
MSRDKEITLENFIKALQILNQYGNPTYPVHCEHDELRIYGIDVATIRQEDIETLDSYGFIVDTESNSFISYAYGS